MQFYSKSQHFNQKNKKRSPDKQKVIYEKEK